MDEEEDFDPDFDEPRGKTNEDLAVEDGDRDLDAESISKLPASDPILEAIKAHPIASKVLASGPSSPKMAPTPEPAPVCDELSRNFENEMMATRNKVSSHLSSMKSDIDIPSQTSPVAAKILKFINDESVMRATLTYETTSNENIVEITSASIKMSGAKVMVPREIVDAMIIVAVVTPNMVGSLAKYTAVFKIGLNGELQMETSVT